MSRYRNYDEDFHIDFAGQVQLGADPGGRSALRAARRDNPRNLPCPTCGEPNRLTPADRAAAGQAQLGGYQCDSCADRDEGGY